MYSTCEFPAGTPPPAAALRIARHVEHMLLLTQRPLLVRLRDVIVRGPYAGAAGAEFYTVTYSALLQRRDGAWIALP